MADEARIVKGENGIEVKGDGWFAVHVSEALWNRSDRFGAGCRFEGDVRFPQIGVNVRVLQPGQPASLYHAESGQEDFYVLSGECLLIIEEQERRLKAGHFVHCPAWTKHVFVGAGDKPCAILMIGFRSSDKKIRYPVSAAATRHGASVEMETDDPRTAYGKLPVHDIPAKGVWPPE